MKNLLVILFLFIGTYATAQKDSTYSIEQLNKCGKLTLTKMYLEQVNVITTLLPNAAFAGTDLQADVPKNKYVTHRIDKVSNITRAYNEIVTDRYKDIIPYADKHELIDAILYLQSIKIFLIKH